MWLAFIAWLLGLAGCNQTTRLYAFELKGSITVASGQASGVIKVELYHGQTGAGELQQPLLFATSFALARPGDFSKSLEFPVESDRSGLVIYAWHDADGDGSLCSLKKRDERAGLFVAKSFPARTITLELKLDQACLGPEAMYP